MKRTVKYWIAYLVTSAAWIAALVLAGIPVLWAIVAAPIIFAPVSIFIILGISVLIRRRGDGTKFVDHTARAPKPGLFTRMIIGLDRFFDVFRS